MGNKVAKNIKTKKLEHREILIPKDVILMIARIFIKNRTKSNNEKDNETIVALWQSCRKIYHDSEIRKIASLYKLRNSLYNVFQSEYRDIEITLISKYRAPVIKVFAQTVDISRATSNLLYFRFSNKIHIDRSFATWQHLGLTILNEKNELDDVDQIKFLNWRGFEVGEYHNMKVFKINWEITRKVLKFVIYVR